MQNTNVPKGWNIKSMGDCFRFLRTKSLSRAETECSGDVKYVHYGDIHTKYPLIISPKEIDLFISTEQAVNADLLCSGDLILLDASEDYEGTTKCIELSNVLPEDKIISGLHTMALRDDHGIFANNFKAYITSMPYVKQNFWKQISGVKVYGISKDNLKKIKVLVPPIEEQKKIAEILETWDRAIEELSDLIMEKKELKRGLMQKLLTGTKRLPGFTKPWKEIVLGDVADFYNGYMFTSDSYIKNGTYKIITIANVQRGFLNYCETNTITKLPADIQEYQILSVGDIIFSMTGNVGRVCTVPIDNCLLNQRVGKIVEKGVHKTFLLHILSTDLFIQKMISLAQGGAQDNISFKDVKKYKFNAPSDIEEQEAIADVLSKADAEIDLLNQQLDVLKEQKTWFNAKIINR